CVEPRLRRGNGFHRAGQNVARRGEDLTVAALLRRFALSMGERMRLLFLSSAALLLLAGCVQATTTAASTADIETGRYIVTSIGGCNDCHTPPLPSGAPDMSRSLQGAPLAFELVPALQGHVPWASTALPIAGGPAGYTDAQFEHFLMTGQRPDGSPA